MKKWPGFEASFDARAARTCAAVLFLELSLAVFLLVSFGVRLALLAPHDADLTRWTRVFCVLEGQGSLESFTHGVRSGIPPLNQCRRVPTPAK